MICSEENDACVHVHVCVYTHTVYSLFLALAPHTAEQPDSCQAHISQYPLEKRL